MIFYLLLPIILGISVVIQGTENRQFGAVHGLSTAVFVNAVVFFLLNLGVFLIAKYNPNLIPEFLQIKKSDLHLTWRHTIPGICGFILVLGLPIAINNIGAARAFLLLIISQIVTGFVWDYVNAEAPLHWIKFAGAALTVLGGALILFAP